MFPGKRHLVFRSIAFMTLLLFGVQEALVASPELLTDPQTILEPVQAVQPAGVSSDETSNPSLIQTTDSLNFLSQESPLSAPVGDLNSQSSGEAASFTLQTEQMTASGGTWNGGTFIAMWGNGAVSSDYSIGEAGIYEVEIFAHSSETGSAALPELRFSVDGDMLGDPLDITNNNWQFQSYKLSGIELTAGLHKLETGVFRSGDGQVISVDRIIFTKTGEMAYPSARVKLESEQMTASGGAWNGGTFVAMWGNGAVAADSLITEAGIYEVEIFANSSETGSAALPELRFSVDGGMPQNSFQVSNNNWQFKSYKLSGIELTAGTHRLETGVFRSGDGQVISVDRMILRKTGEIGYPNARVQVEVEQMTASGGTWDGGTFTAMWGTGAVSADSVIAESGIYEVEIFASAIENGNPALPQLRFSVDGDMMQGPVDVTNNNWQFKSYKLSGIELTAGTHHLGIGSYRTADGQVISVDRFVLRKTGEMLYPSARGLTEAEQMTASGGTWNGGTFTAMWGDGAVSSAVAIAELGIYEIEIFASANVNGNPALPQLRISVNGSAVQGPVDVTNNNWQFKSYKLSGIELTAGSHRLDLSAYLTAAGQVISVDRVILRKISSLWQTVSSNANYAFRVNQEGAVQKLELMELSSQRLMEVAELSAGELYPRFQNIVNVSADGNTVIYGTLQSDGIGSVYVQRLGDSAKKISSSGVLQTVLFVPGGETARLDFQGGKYVFVRLPALASEPPVLLEEHQPNGVTSYFDASDGALERVAIDGTGAIAAPSVDIVSPIMIQTPNSANGWTLQFDQAMKGVRYEIQFRTSPGSNDWQTAGSLTADRYGDISWQDPVPGRGVTVEYRVVPREMTTVSDLLTQINLLYFKSVFGLVESTHEYPLEAWATRTITQPSNFGFHADLLATIATGDLVTSVMTKAEAIRRLDVLMTHLLEDQGTIGYRGLLPWFEYSGTDWVRMDDAYGRQVSFEDNSNLSNALGVAYGALLDESLAGNTTVHGDGLGHSGILDKISQFLANQRDGYVAMYDSAEDTFYRTMQIQDGTFTGGVIDYFGAESSAPLLFLILQYGDVFSPSAYRKLDFATRSYVMQDKSTREVVAPFTGAFHLYWPALLMPESDNADLRNMLETYTDVQLDYADRTGQPGFLSADYDIRDEDLLDKFVAAFSWTGDHVLGTWEGDFYHVTSPTNAGIGVVFNEGASKFTLEGSEVRLRYSSTTPVPNAKIEFKKKIGGVLQTVYTQNLSLANTGGTEQTASFTLPTDGTLGELTEIVFVTSGGGALDLTLRSLNIERVAYNFPLGIKEIALNSAEAVEPTPSVYSLGPAHMFRPAQVEALLQELVSSHRDLITSHGLWEGKQMTTGRVVYEQIFNNVATFVLGMAGTSPSYMSRYLSHQGWTDELQNIWDPQTPLSVMDQSVAYQFTWNGYSVTAWHMRENIRTSAREIRLTYSSATAIHGAKLELKHPLTNDPIYEAEFDLPATGGASGQIVLSVPSDILYWYIAELSVLFPGGYGFPSSLITSITIAP